MKKSERQSLQHNDFIDVLSNRNKNIKKKDECV